MLEKILSNVNYNIKKIVEELREKIKDIPEINEVVDKRQIIYQYSGEDFCLIKINVYHSIKEKTLVTNSYNSLKQYNKSILWLLKYFITHIKSKEGSK